MQGAVNIDTFTYIMRSGKKICYFLRQLLFELTGLKEVQILFVGRKMFFV